MAELDLRLEEWRSAELKRIAADFYHELILFCKAKALNIVLTNKEGEGFEGWRASVNKYEPTSKATVVGKLAELLRTPFEGDLLGAITTFERKVMIYEAQSRETISNCLKIGCVIARMGQSSMREHLLLSATKCDSWTNVPPSATAGQTSFEKLNRLSTRRKPSVHRRRWKLTHFKVTATSPENTDTLRKSVGIRAMGGAEKPQCALCGKNIMDSVGHGAARHPTKIHSKSKGGRGGNQRKGKGKGKKGQRLNEITEPPEEQWTGGSWEQW